MSTRAVQSSGAVTPSSSSRLLEAEVNRLIRTISPYGVLRKDTLARACGARAWRPGRFDAALRAAVREGRLRQLALGFYSKELGERNGL